MKKLLLVVGLIMLVFGSCVGVGFAIFSVVSGIGAKLTEPVDQLVTALDAEDYATVHSQLGKRFRGNTNPEELAKFFTDTLPASRLTNVSYNSFNINNDTGSLGGTLADGTTVEFTLVHEDERWKLDSVAHVVEMREGDSVTRTSHGLK